MATTAELAEEIKNLGEKLGIPEDNIRAAISRCEDKPALREQRNRWRKKHLHQTKQIHAGMRRREDQHRALASEDKHQRFKNTDRARLLAERKRATLGDRLNKAMIQAKVMESKASTSSLASSRGGDERVGPPGAFDKGLELIDWTPIQMIQAYVEDFESQLDAVTGQGPPVALKTEAALAKRLRDFDGVHSSVVADYFEKSQRWVEKFRSDLADEAGVKISPSTGLPR